MIYESFPWKEELLKISHSLEVRLNQKRWIIRTSFLFEKEIFTSFYIIRKLIEAEKVSTKNKHINIPCYLIPSTGKTVTRFNKHRATELYDFTKYKKSKINILDLCHQVIHSYIFDPTFDEDLLLVGFWVSSEKSRNNSLYSFVLDDVIKVFKIFGNDYPNSMSSIYDEKIKDYRIYQSMLTNKELNAVQIMHNKQLKPTA